MRVAELVKTKLTLIFKMNKGFKTLLKIWNIINNEYDKKIEGINITLTPGQIASFKYVPVTPCDKENSTFQSLIVHFRQFKTTDANCIFTVCNI